jgi:hypothetical protein
MANVAVAGDPTPPEEVIGEVVFRHMPGVIAVTWTEKVQEPPGARIPLVNETVLEPGTAVIVAAPHELLRALGIATTMQAGNVSVKLIPVKVAVVGLEMVKVKVVVAPALTVAGLNDLLRVSLGGGTGLHFPNEPAAKMDWISGSVNARLKISSSSTLPRKSLVNPPPMRSLPEFERVNERIAGSKVNTRLPST